MWSILGPYTLLFFLRSQSGICSNFFWLQSSQCIFFRATVFPLLVTNWRKLNSFIIFRVVTNSSHESYSIFMYEFFKSYDPELNALSDFVVFSSFQLFFQHFYRVKPFGNFFPTWHQFLTNLIFEDSRYWIKFNIPFYRIIWISRLS